MVRSPTRGSRQARVEINRFANDLGALAARAPPPGREVRRMSRWLPGDALGWLLLAFGLGSLANAGWMLAAPLHWYHELPAEVPDFGPFNPHFVRDIGCAFATVGVALVWAALAPARRFALVATATVFYAAHAVLHVYDTLREAVDAEHLLLDFPGVYLPALVLLAVAAHARRREGGLHATRADR
jgi:hypothetical protein